MIFEKKPDHITERFLRPQTDINKLHDSCEKELDRQFDNLGKFWKETMAIAIYGIDEWYSRLLATSLGQVGYSRVWCSKDRLEYAQYCGSLNGDLVAMVVNIVGAEGIDIIKRFKGKCKLIVITNLEEHSPEYVEMELHSDVVIRKNDDAEKMVYQINSVIKEIA